MISLLRVGLLLTALLAAGCSSFDSRWRTAAHAFAPAVTRWDGRWTSAQHHTPSGAPVSGRLRCIFERPAQGPARAEFRANWLTFATNYTVQLERQSTSTRGVERYAGTHTLPKIFGGLYRYDAQVTPERFRAHYSSAYDEGSFAMTRQLTTSAAIH